MRKQIEEQLEKLEQALREIPAETEKAEEKVAQIRSRLREGEPAENLHGMVEKLREEIAEFEVEHPRLVSLINQAATLLSNMGI